MKAHPRLKETFRLSPEVSRQLADYARSRRKPKVAVVEAALASFFSPDGADRLEAAVSRRLDRLNRELERLEWQVELTTEALSLFIRFWLTTNAPLPDTALAAAQAMGKERWDRFVESLNRRMDQGPKLKTELARDVKEQESTGFPVPLTKGEL
jgi:uncharacterized protein YdaU (DUF1376 family)